LSTRRLKPVLDDKLDREFKVAWLGAVENTGIRGKIKRALIGYAEGFAHPIMEGLQDAPTDVWNTWRDYADTWAEAEVRRIFADLTQLGAAIHKAAWERARDERRRKAMRRRDLLQSEIIVHVRKAGGAIEYAPASVAKKLAKGRKSRSVALIEKTMHHMCRNGAARRVRDRKGTADRLVLLI
jgi:hypothetical protein